MRSVAAVMLVSVISTQTMAQDSTAAMMGPGANSCAVFGQRYRVDPELVGTLYFTWAQGFMSGLNLMQLTLERPMRDLSAVSGPDQQMLIQSACNKRPLSLVAEVVQDYFHTLPSIPRQSN